MVGKEEGLDVIFFEDGKSRVDLSLKSRSDECVGVELSFKTSLDIPQDKVEEIAEYILPLKESNVETDVEGLG